jgi:DNA repair protein RecN (Recombination protein N)
MLTLLKINNIALIDELEIEFGSGLNVLTGETGSGKSIIVDSLGAVIGDRVSSDLIKEGTQTAKIEGLFALLKDNGLRALLNESGIEVEDGEKIEIIVRRELSRSGKNRIFVNNQLATQSLLRSIGSLLADIHGQGEQATLFDVSSHVEMLDESGKLGEIRERVKKTHHHWNTIKTELGMLQQNEAEKLQLLDILRFQVTEIEKAALRIGEDVDLEEEKRRLSNVEKLSSLSEDSYTLLYEAEESTIATFERAARKISELAEYDSRFSAYLESLAAAQAVINDLAITLRDFSTHIEFSPERLNEIEDRLAEISRLKRKYGDTVAAVLHHLNESKDRLDAVETSEIREGELRQELAKARVAYLNAAGELHNARVKTAAKFEKDVEKQLKNVALEKARFEVRVESPSDAIFMSETADTSFSARGYDRVEFYFSANPGESLRPLAKVASGGEASRVMLMLKTVANLREGNKTAVFDEVDVGIGGRVAEAVGRKLKSLASSQQVLCVTHQPQIASLADRHFVVEKNVSGKRTAVKVKELDQTEQVDEIARMLAGEKVTETAREHAREMLAGRP